MQIVINISEETKRAIDMGTVNLALTANVWAAIRNGIPLPEHHGDLKDVNKIKKEAIDIPDNITNGNVIKTMFPNAYYESGKQFVHITNINSVGELSVPLKWWNAPYKGGESE